MTLNAVLDALEWPMYEKGLGRYMTPLRAFANAAAGSGVTLTGATFGALDLAAAADVAQAATGATAITPAAVGFVNSGENQIPASTANLQPTAGFRR